MIPLFEAFSCFDESGLKLLVYSSEDTTEVHTLTWIKIFEIREVPSLVQASMGLCDEELFVFMYEQVAKITSRFADANNTRLVEGSVQGLAIECDYLHLGMDEATSALSIRESDT